MIATPASGPGIPTSEDDRRPGTPPGDPSTTGDLPSGQRAGFWGLTIGSVGVVYGDIGTSPLYALREALNRAAEDGVSRPEVLGVVSLLLWALILIVTAKYTLFLLRADNRGEGGILSLLALVQTAMGGRIGTTFLLGAVGAALFYGDALITPAISVLSAVEGLTLVTPVFEPYILGISIAIVVGLFLVQARGTGAVAAWFGPITTLWFVVLGALGLVHIAEDPGVLAAFNPVYAVRFLIEHGFVGAVVLGAVFLAVTGAEALYADLGHFGRRPIQAAWTFLVFPALALNYLGQGALVLADPGALRNPFFMMVPDWGLLPLVVLATVATIIASQAVITGAFSLTRQAIQLGLLPRLEIRHTSHAHSGQIYLPLVNWLLLAGVIGLILLFETSAGLASAYGIAVTGTMLVTTALVWLLLRHGWNWPVPLIVATITPFAAIEIAFLGANLLKILDGGYVPILLAAAMTVVMWTWARGTAILARKAGRSQVPLADFVAAIEQRPPAIVPGTAVFLTSDPASTPGALLHNLKHNHVLHESNVILTVRTADQPRIPDADRLCIAHLAARFVRVEMRFGYMETPNVTHGLAACRRQGIRFDIMSTSFFLGRRTIRPDARSGMPVWQDRLFIALAEVAADPTGFYRLPPNRVVELGSQVTV